MRSLGILLLLAASCSSGPEHYARCDGGLWSRSDTARATILFFIDADCPISNSYAPEMKRLHEEFGPRRLEFVGVYGDPAIPLETALKHSREFGYPFPTLLDPDQRLARVTGATVIPEAAILDVAGKVLYLGRIDDLYLDYRNRRPAPQRRDLRNAIEALLAGRPVSAPAGPAVGCFISFEGSGGKP